MQRTLSLGLGLLPRQTNIAKLLVRQAEQRPARPPKLPTMVHPVPELMPERQAG